MNYTIPDKIIEYASQVANPLQIIMFVTEDSPKKEQIHEQLRRIQAYGDDIKALANVLKVLSRYRITSLG